MPRVTKSTYAKMRNRAPSAVSNWIADGKLKAPALVEDDGAELVDVELADAMLAAELDPRQQAAPDDPDNRRFVKARADRMEAEAEGLVRRRQEETGKWLEAEAARRAFGREIAAAITETEAWLMPTAEILAAEIGAERKAVLVILRREWRAFRARQAQAKRGEQPAPAIAAE